MVIVPNNKSTKTEQQPLNSNASGLFPAQTVHAQPTGASLHLAVKGLITPERLAKLC